MQKRDREKYNSKNRDQSLELYKLGLLGEKGCDTISQTPLQNEYLLEVWYVYYL